MTNETKVVMGVTCSVVHDVESRDGRVVEDTTTGTAQDKDGTVWYFGEATKAIQTDGSTSMSGSWEAGVNGGAARHHHVGQSEAGRTVSAGVCEGSRRGYGAGDRASGESVSVKAGSYHDCVKTKDWSAIERGNEFKWYAARRGICPQPFERWRSRGTGFNHSSVIPRACARRGDRESTT